MNLKHEIDFEAPSNKSYNFCHNRPYAMAENCRSNKVMYTLPLMSTSKVIVNARVFLHVRIHVKEFPFNIFVRKSNCCKILI